MSKKFRVYAVFIASRNMGEFEADTKDEALEMAENADVYTCLCHQCASEIDLNSDPMRYDVEVV